MLGLCVQTPIKDLPDGSPLTTLDHRFMTGREQEQTATANNFTEPMTA